MKWMDNKIPKHIADAIENMKLAKDEYKKLTNEMASDLVNKINNDEEA